jgi:hypothetical protein
VLSSRGYFFDNPRRYDSDDDLAWSIPPQNNSTRYSTVKTGIGYFSVFYRFKRYTEITTLNKNINTTGKVLVQCFMS